MGVLNRTSEFHDILYVLSAKGGLPDCGSEHADPTMQPQSELNVWSAEIGSDIHGASVRVQELRRLARRKDIFEDRTAEIQRLSHSVKLDIDALSRKLEALEEKAGSRGPNKNYQVHTFNVIKTLEMRVFQVSKEFKEALEDRMRSMEHQASRRGLYSLGHGASADATAPRGVPMPSGNEEDPEACLPLPAAMDTKRASSRLEAVQNIQRTIGEVAQLVQKAAVMVTAQEESVKRIEQDTEETLSNLDSAQEALLDHFRQLAPNRGLVVKVFLVLLFFVVFFVVFLA
uniref:t-SNARE coiled-coil homology domain-containing protein n=1 Tax=Alexandrium catenella TaxID=2925 RepID=A0A7S1S3B4_ALECA